MAHTWIMPKSCAPHERACCSGRCVAVYGGYARMCQACVGALHRADRRRAPDVNRLRINLHMCIAPGRRTTRTNRKPIPHKTCARALHHADRRRAPIASQLRINPHICVAPNRYAARGKRKSTPHQPAHARCTEPTGGAHQTQVNFASIRTCALHRADTRRAPNTSQPRVEPAHSRCTEPTRGAHQT